MFNAHSKEKGVKLKQLRNVEAVRLCTELLFPTFSLFPPCSTEKASASCVLSLF